MYSHIDSVTVSKGLVTMSHSEGMCNSRHAHIFTAVSSFSSSHYSFSFIPTFAKGVFLPFLDGLTMINNVYSSHW